MRYHTTNPNQRAADIARREAQKVYDKTHDFSRELKTFAEVYQQTLKELQPQDVVI